jgi:hypothetical protein
VTLTVVLYSYHAVYRYAIPESPFPEPRGACRPQRRRHRAQPMPALRGSLIRPTPQIRHPRHRLPIGAQPRRSP